MNFAEAALFHDAVFKRVRIADETASAAMLEAFLSPLLERMLPKD